MRANQEFKGTVRFLDTEQFLHFTEKDRGPLAEHKYATAVVTYSKALELSPANAVLLSNRAFAHLKLENYGSAVEDSSKAIVIDPKYIKVRELRLDSYLFCFVFAS